LNLRERTLVVFAGDNGTAPGFKEFCTIAEGKQLSGCKHSMLVAADTQDAAAIAARKRLQTVLDQLNPAGGMVDRRKKKPGKYESDDSGNANAPDE